MTTSIPIALPDEHAMGVLGRLARQNGLISRNQMIRALRANSTDQGNVPLLWLIGEAIGLSKFKIETEHSMLPALFPINRYSENPDASSKRVRLVGCLGLLPADTMGWCPSCRDTDTATHGFSYWRRQHQLPGIDWCREHVRPTVQTPIEMSFNVPGHQNTHGPLSVSYVEMEAEIHNPAILRLEKILTSWLLLTTPYSITAWVKVVTEACKKMDLRTGEIGKRSVVSDLIQDQFPHSWLFRYMPEVVNKKPATYIRKIDGAAQDKHLAYPALTCATILAVLFDDADEALAALQRACKVLDIPVNNTAQAMIAFCKGMSLKEACLKFGASVNSVEAALRQQLKAKSASARQKYIQGEFT